MPKPPPLSPESVWPYALRLLGQRNYSQASLIKKLRQRQVAASHCQEVVAKLVDLGLINDATYAEALARNEARYRRTSQRMMALKLRQKGIAPELIESALAQDEEAVPRESDRALYHARQYYTRHKDLPEFELKQKLAAYLFRKGFPSKVIQEVIRNIADFAND